MEFRALMQQAHEEALRTIVEVDEEFESCFGRSCGGLTWSYLLEDAEVVLTTAGSLANEATVAADMLREAGVPAGVLGIRSYRPFPAEQVAHDLARAKQVVAFDKSLSYGYGGPIYIDIQAALFGHKCYPEVYGYVAGLGGRDINASQLADAVRESLEWSENTSTPKPVGWINLQL